MKNTLTLKMQYNKTLILGDFVYKSYVVLIKLQVLSNAFMLNDNYLGCKSFLNVAINKNLTSTNYTIDADSVNVMTGNLQKYVCQLLIVENQ